jgi:flagellar hook assembly protein FlgD
VILKIYDVNGNFIETITINNNLQLGENSYTFDGSNLPSGVYYYIIFKENIIETKTMVISR